jgi:hypothetical protein
MRPLGGVDARADLLDRGRGGCAVMPISLHACASCAVYAFAVARIGSGFHK